MQLLSVLLVIVPLAIGGVAMLLAAVPQLAALLGPEPLAFTSWTFYGDALAASVRALLRLRARRPRSS